MKKNILLFLLKCNIFYPWLLGYKFFKYKKQRIIKNLHDFDNEKEMILMVNYAIQKIPYYKSLYKTPIHSKVDFEEQINTIDKSIVMSNFEDFVLPNISMRRIHEETTGGTSGPPLRLLLPKNRYIFELATMYTMWETLGWKGEIRAVLRNTKLEKENSYKINPIKKEIIFDGFETSEAHYKFVYNTIKNLKIRYIHAYPSSIYQFAQYIDKANLDTSFIKGVFCGSEAFLPEQRALVENKLGMKVFNWYGHSEKLILGGRCKKCNHVHIEPTYGYFELLDEKGDVINETGIVGEMVGTTLHNKYMPLIRYRTGDYAEYVSNHCGMCNRKLKVIKNIQGRRELNKIYLNNGKYITTTALNLHSDLNNFINGMQYIQREEGSLEIYLIKASGYDRQIEQRFKAFFTNALSNYCKFELIYVEQINKEPNGKFLPLKQMIKK